MLEIIPNRKSRLEVVAVAVMATLKINQQLAAEGDAAKMLTQSYAQI